MSNTLEVETPEGGIEKSDIKEAEEEVINNNNNNNNGIIVTENNINNTEPPPAKDKDTEEITSEKEEEQQETTSDQEACAEACECEDGTCEDDSNTTDTQNTTKNIPIKKKKRRSRKSTLSQPLSRHSSSPELPTHLTKINKSIAQKDVLSDSQTTTTTTTVSDGATSPKHPNTMTKSTSEPLPITADIASLINEKSSTPSSSSSSSSSSSPKIPTSIPPNIAPHSPYDTSHIPQHLLDLTPPPTRGRSNAFYGSKAPPPLLHSHSDGAAIASQQTSNTIAARRNTTTAGMMMMAHGGVVPAGMQLTLSIPEPSCSGISKPKMFNYWRSLSTSHCEKVLSPSRRFLVGFAETIGRRPTMEDCMVVHGSFRGRGHEDYFALFDGHGGKDAADFAALHLHEILAEKLKTSNAVKSLREAFAETHNLIADQKIIGGTTAVVALFIGKKGFIANVGDTRAVLCRDGVPLRVSLDHKPELPAEMSRIRKLGGTVTTTYNSAGQATSRVNGMLAVSRALGDAVLSPYVSSEPEIHGPLNLDTESRNQFVVLACDGVWDVLSDEEATSIVAPIANPEIASRRLRDEAFARGSTDNISVMVIRCPPFLPCD